MKKVLIDLDACRMNGYLKTFVTEVTKQLRLDQVADSEIFNQLVLLTANDKTESLQHVWQEINPNIEVSGTWEPAQVTHDLLKAEGIPESFIRKSLLDLHDQLTVQQKNKNNWFSKQVKRKWAIHKTQALAPTKPSLIKSDWTPSEETYFVLNQDGISRSYIESLIPAFILYWSETQISSNTWSSKFIKHTRHQWGQTLSAIKENESRATRDVSSLEALSDHSWAHKMQLPFISDQEPLKLPSNDKK